MLEETWTTLLVRMEPTYEQNPPLEDTLSKSALNKTSSSSKMQPIRRTTKPVTELSLQTTSTVVNGHTTEQSHLTPPEMERQPIMSMCRSVVSSCTICSNHVLKQLSSTVPMRKGTPLRKNNPSSITVKRNNNVTESPGTTSTKSPAQQQPSMTSVYPA